MINRIMQKIGDGGFLFIATLIVNAGNYGINLLLGRFLGPAAFAEANLLATMVLLISFAAVGLQLCTAKFTANYHADNDLDGMFSFLKLIQKNAFKVMLGLTVVLVLISQQITSFLNFESSAPIVILCIGIPMYFSMSIYRGYYQGRSLFKKLALSYLMEMFGRLIPTVLLLSIALKYNLGFTSEIVAFGFLASFGLSYLFSKIKINTKHLKQINTKPIITFLIIVGIYELSQILINNSDVILVKHYFPAMEAGLYASLALIGRVVYFATWTIVTLLFPKVIEKEKKGEQHSHLFFGALAIVGGVGCMITISCFFMGTFIVQTLFGAAYLSIASLLWKYAMATTLFACANVFAYYHMSLNNYVPVALSLIAGVCQIIGIALFHIDLAQIITVQISLMTILLLAMITFHTYNLKAPKLRYSTRPI